MRTITYNADNMPVTIVHAKGASSDTIEFVYDGEKRRVKKVVNGVSETYYISEHFEVRNGIETKCIFAGNLRITKITSSNRYFYHKDHLGSSTVMTDYPDGEAEESTEYMPFGRDRTQPGINLARFKFTDQEWDNESGLYNYDARLYDPVIGRFISPDTIVPYSFDPQMLNRYSYVRNNPLIYIDPSGHELGPTGPGGPAEFDREDSSHKVGDSGWREIYNPSAPTQVNVDTFQHGVVIVQEINYSVERDGITLASVKETRKVGYKEPEGTPFEELNKKFKEGAIEPTPETSEAMGKSALCTFGAMMTLGLAGPAYGVLEAYGYASSLPAVGSIGIGVVDAAAPGPPSTGIGQLIDLGEAFFDWCYCD